MHTYFDHANVAKGFIVKRKWNKIQSSSSSFWTHSRAVLLEVFNLPLAVARVSLQSKSQSHEQAFNFTSAESSHEISSFYVRSGRAKSF